MVAASVKAPKYPPGRNPASLANLKPPWKRGESGHASGTSGPMITPHLRRFATLPVSDFYRLPLYSMTMAEAIAAGLLTLSLQASGSKERDQVLDRLDGGVAKNLDVEVNPGSGWLTLQQQLKALNE